MPNKSDQAVSIKRIRDGISARYGIYFPENRFNELARKLKPALKHTGFHGLSDLATALLADTLNDEQRQALIHALTVGETYFFRELEAIEALGHTIIPSLSGQGRRHLRIWCAGCATGEEPYTLAMFLLSTLPDIKQRGISILATDINFTFLNKAKEALYTPWSFRSIPKRYRSLYFRDVGGDMAEVLPSVRDMVTFHHLNLAEDCFPSQANGTHEIDVIFCRNVLMYFETDIMKTIIKRFSRALVPDGWLVVSQTECCDYFNIDFDAVQCGGITIYRRKSSVSALSTRSVSAKPPLRTVSTGIAPAEMTASYIDKPLQVNLPVYSENHSGSEQTSAKDLFKQARRLADSGLLDDACASCEELIRAESLNFDGHMLHATILQEAQRFDEARKALRKVLYLKPDYVMGYYSLGIIEQKLGNRREALRYFDTAARMLTAYQDNTALPEMEGLTAGRLREFLDAARKL